MYETKNRNFPLTPHPPPIHEGQDGCRYLGWRPFASTDGFNRNLGFVPERGRPPFPPFPPLPTPPPPSPAPPPSPGSIVVFAPLFAGRGGLGSFSFVML